MTADAGGGINDCGVNLRMYCGKCGKINAEGVRFCIHCGSDLAQQTPEPSTHAETVPDARSTGRDALDVGGPPAGAPAAEAGTPHVTPADTVRPGRTLAGRYRIVKRLGVGGMGEVFQALDAELNDMPVAIKVLPPILAGNTRSIERLRTEAAISLKLTHPNICRLHTFRTEGELKFLVMEFIAGHTLEEMLDGATGRRLTPEKLQPIARDVAEALDCAHGQDPSILHRDIKPSNVMATPAGVGKVLDFGIARELKDSMTRMTGKDTSGTLLYMSPEQFTGGIPTAASDIYSFAAMIYECLSGHPPFWQGSIGHQLLNQRPGTIPDVPDYMNTAIQLGLAKGPAERPKSAAELVTMLEGKAAPLPEKVADAQSSKGAQISVEQVAYGRAGAAPRARPKRRRALKAFVTFLLLVAAVAGVGYWRQWWPQSVLQLVGLSRSGGPIAPPVTPVELGAVKAKADKAWQRVRGMDLGDAGAKQLNAIPILRDEVVVCAGNGQYAQAKSIYEDIIARCDQLVDMDRQKRLVAALQEAVEKSRKAGADEKAEEFAPSSWSRAETAAAAARSAFERAEFADAQRLWQNAEEQYRQARDDAIGAKAVAAAKDEYNAELAKVDEEKLKQFGGEQWQGVQDKVDAAARAGRSWSSAAAYWNEATKLIAVAVPATEKRYNEHQRAIARAKQIETHLADADKLLAGGELTEAMAAVEKALAIQGDEPASLAMREQIEIAIVLADAVSLVDDDPVKALRLCEDVLKRKPGQEEATKLRSLLRNLYCFKKRLEGHREWVTSLAFRPDGKRLASGSWDDTLKIWALPEGACLRTILAGADVESVRYSPDAKRLAWGVGSKLMIQDGPMSSVRRALKGHVLAVRAVDFSPTGKLIATGSSDSTLRIWDAASGLCQNADKPLTHDKGITCIAFSPDGRLLASGSEDKSVRIWNLAALARPATLIGHKEKVTCVGFSPDGKRLVSAGMDGSVRIWDVARRTLLKTLPGRTLGVSAAAFSRDGRWIVSAGDDKTLRLWEVASGRCVQRLKGHTDWVRAAAFSPDGNLIASAGDDKTIMLWSRLGGKEGLIAGGATPPAYQERWDAVRALGKTKNLRAIGLLVDALGDEEKAVAFEAVDSLEKIGKIAVPHLISRLTNPKAQVRELAALSLGTIGAKHASVAERASEALKAARDDPNAEVRKAVAGALATIAKAREDRARKAEAVQIEKK